MHHLDIQGIAAAYGDRLVLNDITLSLEKGQIVSLIGPSGSGKSSLLRMLVGLLPPQRGTVHLEGRLLDYGSRAALRQLRDRFAIVFKQYNLFQNMDVLRNVTIAPIKVKGWPREACEQDAKRLLAKVGLGHLLHAYPDELSGGQQQRVALARALVTDPSILLLDEPLSALDPFLRIKVRAELKRFQRDLGISFIHVTHSQEEALALADLIVVMSDGKIEQQGTPPEIFNTPRTEFVARFIGGHNIMPMGGGTVSVRTDRTRLLPEAADDAWPVTVREVEYQGTTVSVALVAADGLEFTAVVPERDFFERPFAVGEAAAVRWDATDVHALAATT